MGPYAPPTYNHSARHFPQRNWRRGLGRRRLSIPTLGYLFINVNDLGQLNGVKDPASGPVDLAKLAGTNKPRRPHRPLSRMAVPAAVSATPPRDMFCNQPPWGELVAVNVNTGDIAWRVPLGVTDSLPADKQNTGRPGEGGSIATASGLVFIGASDDPASAPSTPKPARNCGPRNSALRRSRCPAPIWARTAANMSPWSARAAATPPRP